MEFIKYSPVNFEGFAWYAAYEDGKPVFRGGVHLMYHAKNAEHAKAMHDQ